MSNRVNQKGFIKDTVIIVLGVLLLGGGYFYFSRKPAYAPAESSNTNQKVADETVGWKTYESKFGQFSINIPREWTQGSDYSTERIDDPEFCGSEHGPLLDVGFDLNDGSKKGGGFSIKGTNKDTCLNGGSGYYGFASDTLEIEKNSVYKKKVGAYTLYFSVDFAVPGAYSLSANIVGYNHGPFTFLSLSYIDEPLINLSEYYDFDKDVWRDNVAKEDCIQTMNPVARAFCKEDKIIFKDKITKSTELFESVVSSFKPL